MTNRIRAHGAFERLRRDGTRIHGPSLWCSFLPDPRLRTPRAAFSVSRAVGPAVTRNRVRRRLRAALAARQLPPGLLLIGVRPTAVELTFAQLSAELDELLDRLLDRVGR